MNKQKNLKNIHIVCLRNLILQTKIDCNSVVESIWSAYKSPSLISMILRTVDAGEDANQEGFLVHFCWELRMAQHSYWDSRAVHEYTFTIRPSNHALPRGA